MGVLDDEFPGFFGNNSNNSTSPISLRLGDVDVTPPKKSPPDYVEPPDYVDLCDLCSSSSITPPTGNDLPFLLPYVPHVPLLIDDPLVHPAEWHNNNTAGSSQSAMAVGVGI